MFDEDKVIVDNEAKLRCPLFKARNSGEPYYVGKLQFPGEIDLQRGVTFMVFISEPESEELQIGPMDHTKRSKSIKPGTAIRPGGKIAIGLNESRDGNGNIFYVGEAFAPGKLTCTHGLFFTVLVSGDMQEIQISMLDHSLNRKRRRYEEFEDEERTGT